MKNFLLILAVLFVSSYAHAYLKYNPYSQSYESATPNSELKYNPYSRQYSYEKPSSKLKYNPYSRKYSFSQPSSELKYNPYSRKYNYFEPDSELKYNPILGSTVTKNRVPNWNTTHILEIITIQNKKISLENLRRNSLNLVLIKKGELMKKFLSPSAEYS